MPTHLVELDTGRLFVETAGAGTALVFLHGFGLDRRMWDPQFELFAQEFRVIRYDFRGFGRSSAPPETSFSHADDLHRLLHHLGAGPAHVVGLSMGGRFALRFVLAFPEEARSLVLVDSALDGYGWSPEWKREWSAIQSLARAGRVSEARRRWLGHPLFAPACERTDLARALREQIEGYSGWHWVNRDTALVPDPPALTQLGGIRQRTLVLVGERDLPDFHRIGAILAGGILRAKLQTVRGSGHMANLEAPAQFNAMVAEFLRSQEPAGAASRLT